MIDRICSSRSSKPFDVVDEDRELFGRIENEGLRVVWLILRNPCHMIQVRGRQMELESPNGIAYDSVYDIWCPVRARNSMDSWGATKVLY